MNIETIQTEAKKTKKKGGHGGARQGAGRKKQPDEAHLIEKLYPLEDVAFTALRQGLAKGDPKSLDIFFRYYFGLPTQRIESKVEGNLNQVNIEVLRPQTETLKKVS
jgi:hypothetical protein